ncbi:MAG: Hsp20/alpha crystallin family protein [Clostridia bacterium]
MKNLLLTNNNDLFNIFDDGISLFKPIKLDEKLNNMRTDIIDQDNNYLLETELSGWDKKDIDISISDGYITISANKIEETTSEDTKRKFIRKERKLSCSRSFYVGDVDENQIKATLTDGLLSIVVPKEEKKTKKQSIAIE